MTATSNSIGNIRKNRKTTKTRKKKGKGKQLYRYFKQQTDEIAPEKTWTWLRKSEKLNLFYWLENR